MGVQQAARRPDTMGGATDSAMGDAMMNSAMGSATGGAMGGAPGGAMGGVRRVGGRSLLNVDLPTDLIG